MLEDSLSDSAPTEMSLRPRVLVAHAFASSAEPLALILGERRPHLDVRFIALEDLDAAVESHPGAVVVGDRLSAAVETHAAGWVLYYPHPDHPNIAVIGDRAGSRRIERPEVADVFAAIDEFVARYFPAVPLDGAPADAATQ